MIMIISILKTVIRKRMTHRSKNQQVILHYLSLQQLLQQQQLIIIKSQVHLIMIMIWRMKKMKMVKR